jgi:hypothetical protein
MDSGITSALAAVMGASVGGLASLASTWIGERNRNRRDLVQGEIVRRESTYSDFIEKASQLYAASATHRIDDDEGEVVGLVSLYALSSRIRLFASDPVILEAEKVVERMIKRYGDEKISAEQLRTSALENKKDPLKDFSISCRRELQDLQRGM